MSEWVDFEARNLRANNALLRQKLEERDNPGVWNQWVKGHLSLEDWVIVPQPPEAYELPSVARDFVSPTLIAELRDILAVMREVNNELAGFRISQAEVILAGDDRVQEISTRLRTWAIQYVELRLDRSRHRREDAVGTFQRIYGELLPRLEEVAFRKGTCHRCFMSEFSDFLPWVLFERTCRPLLDVEYDSAGSSVAFRILSLDPRIRAYLEHIVQLYQWSHAGDLAQITKRVAAGCTSHMDSCDDTDRIKTRLRLLVSDIQEMRPFLLHNFKPENVVVKVADGVVVSWWWAVGRGSGLVPIAPSVEVMMAELRKMSSRITLTLLYDGLLACYAMPWLDAAGLQAVHDYALEANLRIVESIHNALWLLYEKVDIEDVLARFRACAKSREPTDEEFAASCQAIAEPIEDESGVLPAPTARLRAVRMQRLLAVLADRLGCEVRQGRGSEIVVYRSGGHHFRLGHHKRNNHVPAIVIKNLLQHVGIGFDEWLNAVV